MVGGGAVMAQAAVPVLVVADVSAQAVCPRDAAAEGVARLPFTIRAGERPRAAPTLPRHAVEVKTSVWTRGGGRPRARNVEPADGTAPIRLWAVRLYGIPAERVQWAKIMLPPASNHRQYTRT